MVPVTDVRCAGLEHEGAEVKEKGLFVLPEL